MRKWLSPRAHGYLDYLLVGALAFAPSFWEFSPVPRSFCYALAVMHLFMTLLTAFPLGLLSVLPFDFHGRAEAGVSLALVAMPWLGDFEGEVPAHLFFSLTALVWAAVYRSTRYRAVRSPVFKHRRSLSLA